MGGKLQNFAKAAILAIAQQNCSNPDALPCRVRPRPTDWRPLNARQYSIGEIRKRAFVSICDETLTSFNSGVRLFSLNTLIKLNKSRLKCLLDETP
ncbi:hypothetical protein C1Y08_02445 [Pseudomonas sp. FW306-02-F02-AA]|nr:hypothetical protein C1Y07_00470 [Pseudomonas sp. FW306-02-F02-AB]PMZ11723.1 hypothetical protein C1Y06_02670 [Pseudomonas sp. FW306-02-H06C]PMZ17645.1 hypothetical protein C1Y08_02445 [Pseudomonas sp. FW306-02-F02-AA]PMZ21265.1 hypothetical protein C1Y09_14170 [Pseudomonas sp. FW306-02-F08-AA]PMZ28164.1 hypothetical protein C1Y05_09285 [Pseudomonas sp. FW306-02-F04-BA]PMZ34012.1 hypothetical protein C1X99_13065 [Pseudomonas sp. FW306-02-H06B]PMZ41075.1 hypothetical protein C1Y00_09420 [Ps